MKRFVIILFLLFPALVFPETHDNEGSVDITKFPVTSLRSDSFKLKNLSFNRTIINTKGEILEVEFQLENLLDISQEFYIFVVATYEKSYKTTSSFESPSLDDTNEIKLIAAYPDDLANFEYVVKDEKGADKKTYIKYPKNIKAGIDAETGKPYSLHDTITFRSRHLSKYGRKFYFFNEIAILIFDKEEKLVFRQIYTVKPMKR